MSAKVSAITGINLLLILYVGYGTFLKYLFAPNDPQKVPYEILFKDLPFTLQALGVILLLSIYVLGGAFITKKIWNGFLIEMIRASRQITFEESILIVLVITALKIA